MNAKKPRVLVIGSSNTDMVVSTPKIPAPGETVLGGSFMVAAGGKGANQAVAAARSGAEVVFVACVGQDSFGEAAVDGFVKEGIIVSHVRRVPGVPSGVALITVDACAENAIVVAPGANEKLAASDIDAVSDEIQHCDVVLTQLETPLATVQHAVAIAWAARKTVILNPAPAQKLDRDLLRNVSILTPNETETEILTGIRVTNRDSAAQAARLLREQGVSTVIITMGAKGAYVLSAEVDEMVPSSVVSAVDTTAAGDVFNGALAVELARGAPLLEAVRYACQAGAISVTRRGAQSSIPFRHEVM